MRSGRASRGSAARSSTICRKCRAFRRRRTSSGYHIGAPQKLTYYADILKYYRALAAATPRVKIETIGKSDEDRELVVVWVSSDANIKNLQQNRDNLAKIADPRGLNGRADQAAHRHDQAALPPDGRPAQRRDRPVGNVDGAGVPAGDGDVAGHFADPRQRVSCRSRRWPTPTAAIATSTGSIAAWRCAVAAGCGSRRRRSRRRRWRRAAVLGQVRLPRQQPRHQPVADADARDHGLVLHRASADHARPARVAGAALHLQRRAAAESEPRSDALLRALRSSRTGRCRR